MSPEVISKCKYNTKTDIWSLGITTIELAEKEPPYSHLHPVRAMICIKNNPPSGLSDENKCAIHTAFSTNDNWPYDWSDTCATGCPSLGGDMNADESWNVLDIVLLANCVLAENCGP